MAIFIQHNATGAHHSDKVQVPGIAGDGAATCEGDRALAVPIGDETFDRVELIALDGDVVVDEPGCNATTTHGCGVCGELSAVGGGLEVGEGLEELAIFGDPVCGAGERDDGITAEELRQCRDDLLADGDAAVGRVMVHRVVPRFEPELLAGANGFRAAEKQQRADEAI